MGETVGTVETEERSEAKQTESESRFLANTLQFQILQDRLKELFNFLLLLYSVCITRVMTNTQSYVNQVSKGQ